MLILLRGVLLLSISSGMLLISTQIAHAHESQTDGTTTVIMHVEPDDKAIVGIHQSLDFYINDSLHKFDPLQCDCVVTIHKGPQTIAMLNPSVFSDVLRASYVFKTDGDYHITLTGAPTGNADFATFTESYDVHVAPAKKTQTSSNIVNVLLSTAVFALFAVLVFSKRPKQT